MALSPWFIEQGVLCFRMQFILTSLFSGMLERMKMLVDEDGGGVSSVSTLIANINGFRHSSTHFCLLTFVYLDFLPSTSPRTPHSSPFCVDLCPGAALHCYCIVPVPHCHGFVLTCNCLAPVRLDYITLPLVLLLTSLFVICS